jgi:hypothetical protein
MVTTQTIISTPGMAPNLVISDVDGVNVLGGSSQWPTGTTTYAVTWIGCPVGVGSWTPSGGDYGSSIPSELWTSPFVVTVLALNDSMETLGVYTVNVLTDE